MEIVKLKELNTKQLSQINKLWDTEYPLSLKGRFKILLDGASAYNHYIIEDGNKKVIAWAADFIKEEEIRFSIIVDPMYQGKGIGSLLMKKLITDLDEFYGWVIDHDNDLKENGEKYKSPLSFYLNLGFDLLPKERINNELLKAVKIRMKSKA